MKNKEIFLTPSTIAYDLINKYTYPYEVLPHIHDYIVEIGNKLDNSYKCLNNNIWIAKDAIIADSAIINGPCIIDHGAELRPNAYIRGDAIIGKNSLLGNSCEIKNSILFDEVQIPHFSYIGDSILGYKSHLGAGVITANQKSDKSNIDIKGEIILKTNLNKVGAFLGDSIEIGCNSVLYPGTIIGSNTTIYPLTNIRGIIKPNVIVKHNNIIEKNKKL